MRLREGLYYRDGRDKIVGPMSFDPSASTYSFKAPNGGCYTPNGCWNVYSEKLSDPRDLIEEVPAPKPVTDLQNALQRLSTLEEQVRKLSDRSKSDDGLWISLAEDYFYEEMQELKLGKSAVATSVEIKAEQRRAASKAFDIADAFLDELKDRRKRDKNAD